MQKRFCSIAALLALSVFLSSCSLLFRESQHNDGQTPVITTAAGGTTAEPYLAPTRPNAATSASATLAALPAADFSGASLLITSASDASGNPLFPTSDTLGEDVAKYNRNTLISARYKVNLVPASAACDVIYQELQNAQNSGLYYTDVLLLPANQVGKFAAANLLRNLRNLPFWSNTGIAYGEDADQGGAGNAVYADLGAAVLDHNSLPAVFFNRTMSETMGQDLYAAVDRGEWTWDLYLRLAADAATLDGVSGHALVPPSESTYLDLITASCGIKFVDNTEGKTPAVIAPDSLEQLDGILRNTLLKSTAYPSNAENQIAALQAFTVDRVLFCITNLSYMDWIYDSKTEWGILPLPSLDGSIHSPTGASAPVLCVSADNNKFEMTGLLLAALNAASTDIITDAYIEERLQNRLRDWQSAAMINRIADSASYDFATLFASGMPGLASATAKAVRDAANGGLPLAQLVPARANAANTELKRMFGVD